MNGELRLDVDGSLVIRIPGDEIARVFSGFDKDLIGESQFKSIKGDLAHALFGREVKLDPLGDILATRLKFGFPAFLKFAPSALFDRIFDPRVFISIKHRPLKYKSIIPHFLSPKFPTSVKPDLVVGDRVTKKYVYININGKYYSHAFLESADNKTHIFIGDDTKNKNVYFGSAKDQNGKTIIFMICHCKNPEEIIKFIKSKLKYSDIEFRSEKKDSFISAISEYMKQ